MYNLFIIYIRECFYLTTKKSKRIFYFDALRALAIISVIVFHIVNGATIKMVAYDPAMYHSLSWFFADLMRNGFRIGVVLFLMLSGALSLGREWSIKTFLSKRIPRIVYPFILWGSFFIIVLTITGYLYNFPPLFANPPIIDYGSFIFRSFLGSNYFFHHFWFFWMIIGTYLIMPIFNKWIANSNLDELEYFLVFWLITCLFTFTLNTEFPIKLVYFTSPIGLVVLGYYLRYTERKLLNNPYIDILLVVLPCIAMVAISYLISPPGKMYAFDRYSIFIAIEVIGVFLLFKNIGKFNLNFNFLTDDNGIFRKSIYVLARYSYGLYLAHFPLLRLFMKLISSKTLPYKVSVMSLFILDLGATLVLLYLFSKIPYIKEYIGVK